MRSSGGGPDPIQLVPFQEGEEIPEISFSHAQALRKGHVRTQQESGHLQARRAITRKHAS